MNTRIRYNIKSAIKDIADMAKVIGCILSGPLTLGLFVGLAVLAFRFVAGAFQ